MAAGQENTVLGRPNHSWSDHRWSVIIEQPIRHLLSQMFQQQVNRATKINFCFCQLIDTFKIEHYVNGDLLRREKR